MNREQKCLFNFELSEFGFPQFYEALAFSELSFHEPTAEMFVKV